jgi:hypothetical protein
MSVSVMPFVRRRAQLGRYALWQLGDFGFNVAIITLLLFGLIGFMGLAQIHMAVEMSTRIGKEFPVVQKLSIFKDLFATYAMVAPLIALSGFISQDRAGGFTRFLFSKPLSPERYYVQAFLVRLVGFVAVGCLLVTAWSLKEPPTVSLRLIADMALMFLSVGGIVLLMSALSKYDGLLVIVFLLIAEIVRETWEKRDGIRHAVTYLFPPFNHVGELHLWAVGLTSGGSIGATPFPTKWVLWNLGYGLACAILGLYLLRKIPLTKT